MLNEKIDTDGAAEAFLLSSAFVNPISYDDGLAAKKHLAAGRPIDFSEEF